MRPCSRETRKKIFELREFDLRFGFTGSRAAGKNIENETRSIQHFDIQLLFEISKLDGSKLIVENRNLDFERIDMTLQLFHFSLAKIERSIGGGPLLRHAVKHVRSGGIGKQRKLVQMFQRLLACLFIARTDEGNDSRAFARFVGLEKPVGAWISQNVKLLIIK